MPPLAILQTACYTRHMSEARSEVTHESLSSDNTHHKPGSFWIVWAAVGLLLIYPLSIGPVAKFYQGRPAPIAVQTFYSPIGALCMRSPAALTVLDWYIHLWGVK